VSYISADGPSAAAVAVCVRIASYDCALLAAGTLLLLAATRRGDVHGLAISRSQTAGPLLQSLLLLLLLVQAEPKNVPGGTDVHGK